MRVLTFLLFCMMGLCTATYAQVSNCPNLGFQMGNFLNWEGYTWINSTNGQLPSTSPEWVNLPAPRRHQIMTDPNATDPNTGGELKMIPPGFKYSARLGDIFYHDTITGDRSPRCWSQSLRYSMTIDSTNALLVLKFAVVLENPNHSEPEEPRFKLTLYDENNKVIPDCANYDVYSTNAVVNGFQSFESFEYQRGVQRPLEVTWRDWTTVGVNLLSYLGQTITVEFMTADCSRGGHGGYAYFVAECRPLYITVNYCSGDTVASLKAPEGFEKYKWRDSAGTLVDSTQVLEVEKISDGATYSCTMTSETGCTVELQSTISRYELKTNFTSAMLDCKSNKVQINNLSTTSRGKLLYDWDFGDGNSSNEEHPQHTFATSGRHKVTLAISNPPSSCVDTLTKIIESFSPPLVGIRGDSTWCPGDNNVWLKAYGAWDYTWSNGLKNDSVQIISPGGKYWLLGHSSTGCVSDTIWRTVGQEPDWEFTDQSNSIMCLGEGPVKLEVTGAYSYLWSTNDTVSSVFVTDPGTYTVIGRNRRGCKKTANIEVVKYPLPYANFIVSPLVIDSRHNYLEGLITPQTDVTYRWDMGDGSSETGSAIQHSYNITNDITAFRISLLATSKFGCTDSSSAIIDVVPFVPNIFSPNGDGINDIFMTDYDLQIVDRNGMVLYKGKTGWDGTYKGSPMSSDTYFYLIHYTDRLKKEHSRKGYITLVR